MHHAFIGISSFYAFKGLLQENGETFAITAENICKNLQKHLQELTKNICKNLQKHLQNICRNLQKHLQELTKTFAKHLQELTKTFARTKAHIACTWSSLQGPVLGNCLQSMGEDCKNYYQGTKIFQYSTCPAGRVTYNFHSSCKHMHLSFKVYAIKNMGLYVIRLFKFLISLLK